MSMCLQVPCPSPSWSYTSYVKSEYGFYAKSGCSQAHGASSRASSHFMHKELCQLSRCHDPQVYMLSVQACSRRVLWQSCCSASRRVHLFAVVEQGRGDAALGVLCQGEVGVEGSRLVGVLPIPQP